MAIQDIEITTPISTTATGGVPNRARLRHEDDSGFVRGGKARHCGLTGFRTAPRQSTRGGSSTCATHVPRALTVRDACAVSRSSVCFQTE